MSALQGKRVLVTRAQEQNEDFSRQLAAVGAIPIELPTIQIVPPDDPAPLEAALGRLAVYDWLIFTSANAVKYVWQRLLLGGKSTAGLPAARLAAIGPATAAALTELGLTGALMPADHIAEALVESMPDIRGQRILLPTADIARPTLADGLRARGAIVDWVVAYQTRPAEAPADLKARLAEVDIITFTSSSTAQNFVAMLIPKGEAEGAGKGAGEQGGRGAGGTDSLERAVIACIGPKTAQTVRDLGLPVHVVAKEHTVSGLVESLETYYAARQ